MLKTQKLLADYVNKATDLAESVRRNIQHNNAIIDNKTVIALNEFIIAANGIKDLTDELEKVNTKLN
jgi:hypothetical protein